jgi:hypothetical protein
MAIILVYKERSLLSNNFTPMGYAKTVPYKQDERTGFTGRGKNPVNLGNPIQGRIPRPLSGPEEPLPLAGGQ